MEREWEVISILKKDKAKESREEIGSELGFDDRKGLEQLLLLGIH